MKVQIVKYDLLDGVIKQMIIPRDIELKLALGCEEHIKLFGQIALDHVQTVMALSHQVLCQTLLKWITVSLNKIIQKKTLQAC